MRSFDAACAPGSVATTLTISVGVLMRADTGVTWLSYVTCKRPPACAPQRSSSALIQRRAAPMPSVSETVSDMVWRVLKLTSFEMIASMRCGEIWPTICSICGWWCVTSGAASAAMAGKVTAAKKTVNRALRFSAGIIGYPFVEGWTVPAAGTRKYLLTKRARPTWDFLIGGRVGVCVLDAKMFKQKPAQRCAGGHTRCDYFLTVDDLLVLASAIFIGAPSTDLPFTCKPACDSLAAVFSRMPLTRFSRSAQSLKSPPLVRSSMMALDLAGPMPLDRKSADTSALLTSTWASANVIVAIRVAIASTIFLIMMSP